ncbi:hypothetical protein ACFCW2_12525 [Qipengyuania sp. DSG2-2]|uniref:hypothetical protein n=1 Tax=Qipengyuania sp. DGS2-2 TaxID=3349631 RepID=UPI0036D2954F
MAGDRRIARADCALPDWYASDAAYRPVPIVWFGGALVMQVIALPVIAWIALMLAGLGPLATATLLMLATGFIWHFTWKRGMHGAATGWQIVTGAMLLFFLAIGMIGLFG